MIGNPGDNCIILARVSDEGKVNKGDSYDDQETAARRVALRNQWTTLRVFKEPLSSRKDVRPVVEEIVAFVRSSPEPVHHLVVRAIDRFSRAGVFEYEKLKERMSALSINIVDSYGVIQPKQNTLDHLGVAYDWSVFSPSETAELIMAQSANQEVRHMLTRMIGAEIKLTREGYKIGQAADGYINKKILVDGKERVIEVPDPERAHFYRKMFRLRAEGRVSDREIVSQLNAMGYRRKPFKRWNRAKDRVIGQSGGGPLIVKRLQEIIRRPIYCGVRVAKWTDGKPVRTRYPGLVSIEIFNAANRGKVRIDERADGSLSISYGEPKTPVRLRNNPQYPYKNVIMCPKCRVRPFLGSASRGKRKYYPAYHCDRGHYVRIPKAIFEEVVDEYLSTLYLEPACRPDFELALRRTWESGQRHQADQRSLLRERVAELRMEQETTLDSIVGSGALVRKKLEARVEELEAQIQTAQELFGDPTSETDFARFLAWSLKLLEHPVATLRDSRHIERQRACFTLLFEEPPTYAEIATGTPKLRGPFELARFFDESEAGLVHASGLAWNSLQDAITQWKKQAHLFI